MSKWEKEVLIIAFILFLAFALNWCIRYMYTFNSPKLYSIRAKFYVSSPAEARYACTNSSDDILVELENGDVRCFTGGMVYEYKKVN